MVNNFAKISFTNTGITLALDSTKLLPNYILDPDSPPLTMAGDIIITVSGTPQAGTTMNFGFGGIVKGANTFTILGVPISALAALEGGNLAFFYYDGGWSSTFSPDFFKTDILDGDVLVAGTVALNKLENLAAANIILGNVSNIPTATAVTGDIAITNAGVTSISAGVIVNADINASAGIAFSKMAALTASKVVVTSAGGVITVANQLGAALGGTNIDTSASTGYPILAAGVWSVAPLTDTLRCDISFVTAAQGTYYVRVPFPCTVTSAKARVTSTVSGTDDGAITLKDNSGTNMTGGLITIPASSAHGTGVAVSITANNTLTANQEIQLLVAKTTSGGACSVDITITRLTLS